jgi:hypothetical protein
VTVGWLSRRHTGPEDHLVGLVQRADRDKDAFVVLEPGLSRSKRTRIGMCRDRPTRGMSGR